MKETLAVAASPEVVYRHLTGDIGKWWDSEHTFSGRSENLYIEDKADGCFCEKLASGGSVRHLVVVFADPGKMLRMSGALGPLQSMGVAGSMTWTLSRAGDTTRVELTYAVGGYRPGGLGVLAPAVDRVLLEQLQRLKRYVETGTPEEKSQKKK